MRWGLTLALLLSATVSAAPSGHRWFTLPPGYRVFTHGSIRGVPNFSTAVRPRIVAAFARWTKSKVSCTRWDVTDLGNFSTPKARAAIDPVDGQNRVLWLDGADWKESSLTLGLTTDTYYIGTGEIFDADMVYNNNITWSSNGSSGTYDFESVITHEAGHFLGLDHNEDSGAAIMFPTVDPGRIKRTLTQSDINDVCAVYPSSTGSGTQGEPCSTDAACMTPLKCRGAPSQTSKICTKVCTSADPACPSGTSCQTANTGMACLAQVGAPDLCRFCTRGSDCTTGNCVTDDGRHNWCTRSCSSDAQCGANYKCVDSDVGMVCAPTTRCSAQCSSTRQCAVGYRCIEGTCEATGGLGDRCEVSEYCKPCGVCIGTYDLATCRPCCGGQGGGGTCNSCAPATCASGTSCEQVSGNEDRVCTSSAAASACQACSASTPCADGQTCFQGRCHGTCSVDNPGACAACFDSGDGAGVCACADEIAFSGQACGAQVSGALRACASGLECLGTPSVCRQRCALRQAGSCPAGYTCAAQDGVQVCVQSAVMGDPCGSCANGACAAGLTCFSGRCYEPCDPSAPACNGCIEVPGGGGLCACDDQQSGPAQACGFQPPSVLSACQPGLTCASPGGIAICRIPCGLGLPACPGGTTCGLAGESAVCLPSETDAGQPARVDAGSDEEGNEPPPVQSGGCGCSGVAAGSTPWLFALLAMGLPLRWRRGRRVQ